MFIMTKYVIKCDFLYNNYNIYNISKIYIFNVSIPFLDYIQIK
jgi:hypothetical protein